MIKVVNINKVVKNRYLIDYENVHSKGLNGIDRLSANDEVIIFYSSKCDSVSFETMQEIFNSEANISMKKVNTGTPNALDFQLVTFVGYIVAKNFLRQGNLHIVSGDHGFDIVIDFWRESKNVLIDRIPSIAASFGNKLVISKTEENTASVVQIEDSLDKAALPDDKFDEERKAADEAAVPVKQSAMQEESKKQKLSKLVPVRIQKKYRGLESMLINAFIKYEKSNESAFRGYIKKHGIKSPNDIKSVFPELYKCGQIDLSNIPSA